MDGGGGGGGYRLESERFLTLSEKLLSARDLHGAKNLAIRAGEMDPRLSDYSDQIITVVDTLLAGELRVTSTSNNSYHDYYAILQLGRLTQSMDLIATHFQRLALMLNPNRNRLPFSDHAFRLVNEAWMVFSDPSKKALYDHEVQMMSQFDQLGLGQPSQPSPPPQQQPQHHQQQQQQWNSVTPSQYQQQPGSSRSSRSELNFSSSPADVEPRATTELNFRATRAPPADVASRAPKEFNFRTPPPPPRVSAEGLPRATTELNFRPSASSKVAEAAPPSNPPPPAPNGAASVANSATVSAANSASVTAANSMTVAATTKEPEVPSFWTVCPYCYYMYEYPKEYEECVLKCQECKRGFQAVVVPNPPKGGKDTYFCCWAYFPLGCTGRAAKRMFGSAENWSPFMAIQSRKKSVESKVVYKDLEISDSSEEEKDDSSDDDWRRIKRVKNTKGKRTAGRRGRKPMNRGGGNAGGGSRQKEQSGKGEGVIGGKKRSAKDLGKLDLNVMFGNEAVEGAAATAAAAAPGASNKRQGVGEGEEDNIEGISFFEGLDEFLSTLPIISGAADDKVKQTQ